MNEQSHNKAALSFADKLEQDAQNEEGICLQAAILVSERLRLKLGLRVA